MAEDILINNLDPTKDNYPMHSVQEAITKRGGRLDRLLVNYTYMVMGILIYIPAGFLWDGASIPRILWPLLGSAFGLYGYAAMVHDYLYASRMVPRKVADRIFYEIMLKHGVNKFKAWLMYKAVSAFGSKAYNKTDERGAISRLLHDGHRLNPYGAYMDNLFKKGWADNCIGFTTQPWSSMDDELFRIEYRKMMTDKWHM